MAKKAVIKDIVENALNTSIQQITGNDATFLYAESPTSPMHVATLTIVEGSLVFEDFKEMIASKLHLIPKFRQRLLNVPMNIDYPYWVDDPNFELDLHLNRIKLPDPSNWKTLRELTSTLFSGPLDLRRPLWSISFVEGIDEIPQVPKGSVAIVTKIHHVMVDGASGVGIMGLLFDKSEGDKVKKPAPPKPYEPEPLPDEFSLLLKSGYNFIKNPLKVPKMISETAFALIKTRAAKKMSAQKEFNTGSFPVPKTIFNGSISPKRTWGTAILAFNRINVLRKLMGVSINDLILAICAGAIRRYLQEREKLPLQPLVANVPISIRVKDSKEMNNQISNMFVQIGTHIEDPIERLEYIQEQTIIGKAKHNAVGAKSLSKMADSVPFGLANLAAGLYSKYNIKELHRPPFNVTITNVPGPREVLYLRGHKIVSIFGLTPVVDGFGLIIAAFSYNGQVSITTTSDANTMPDADKFSRYVRESANELEKLIKKKGKKKTVTAIVKSKSTPFFNALKKYIKNNPTLKKYGGLYEIQVNLGTTKESWQLDLTKKEGIIKKLKALKPKASIQIDDENLYDLYKGKLLLEELKIQGRIKLQGQEKHKAKLILLMTEFLAR
ncbi:MAG: wax ester/triacylglycerol synthase family O-acyltransferase [Flavobacteriaceae bacterium]|nr:wax ester/triacylglycerol synthase family O-acyltransferase [Flavobacteriaceae bacterium]